MLMKSNENVWDELIVCQPVTLNDFELALYQEVGC